MHFQIDVILGEPFFLSSLSPWHDLYFWYASRDVMSIFNHYKIKVYPGSACLKAIAGTWNIDRSYTAYYETLKKSNEFKITHSG